MPTLATGNKPHRAAPGFTLLELMLVLAVMALATGLVLWRMPNPDERALREEAELLATQLQALRHHISGRSAAHIKACSPQDNRHCLGAHHRKLTVSRQINTGQFSRSLPHLLHEISGRKNLDERRMTHRPCLHRFGLDHDLDRDLCLAAR